MDQAKGTDAVFLREGCLPGKEDQLPAESTLKEKLKGLNLALQRKIPGQAGGTNTGPNKTRDIPGFDKGMGARDMRMQMEDCGRERGGCRNPALPEKVDT